MAPGQKSDDTESSSSRRHFLKAALAVSGVLTLGGVAAIARSLFSPLTPAPTPSGPQTVTRTVTVTGASGSSTTVVTSTGPASPFPRVKVASLSDLAQGKPVFFNYPLEETPNMLVKLGTKAQGGVGPDGDVVAYSVLCQHLGCVYGFVDKGGSPACNKYYKADSPVGYCCCHGSIFDLANAGAVLDGPSPRPAPQVIIELDSSSGDVYATGMTPPSIFGHSTGSNDILEDLKGGTLVG